MLGKFSSDEIKCFVEVKVTQIVLFHNKLTLQYIFRLEFWLVNSHSTYLKFWRLVILFASFILMAYLLYPNRLFYKDISNKLLNKINMFSKISSKKCLSIVTQEFTLSLCNTKQLSKQSQKRYRHSYTYITKINLTSKQ